MGEWFLDVRGVRGWVGGTYDTTLHSHIGMENQCMATFELDENIYFVKIIDEPSTGNVNGK